MINWKPYPEFEPKNERAEYLVTVWNERRDGSIEKSTACAEWAADLCIVDGVLKNKYGFRYFLPVSAFAEMPAPYEGK